jgi:SAM-dependent methyltransferase
MPILGTRGRAKAFFDALAPFYDALNTRIYRPAMLAKVRAALEDGPVLDVGVGTGYTTRHRADAVGIDLSPAMVGRASGYAGELVVGDASRPPFRPGTFGSIVAAGSFYYLPDPEAALGEFHRLLRPGGVLVILSPYARFFAPLVRVYRRADYERLFDAAGFAMETFVVLSRVAAFVKARKVAPRSP